MNLLCAISAFAVTASLVQDDRLAAKLDYETVAVPIARALDQIGQKTGVELKVNDNLGRPIVLISAKGVTLRELMDRIAQATGGEWLQEGNVHRLVRDAAVQNREAAQERRAKVEATQRAIAKMVEETLKSPPAAPPPQAMMLAARQFGFGTGGGAIQRAIAKIAATLDPALIAGLEPDGRLVFSTAPTRMQRPFAGNVAPVFSELVAEHNKEIARRAGGSRPLSADEQEILDWVQAVFGSGFEGKPVEERPAKALLVVTSGQFFGFGSGYTLELRLYGANGKVLLMGQHRIPGEDDIASLVAGAFGGEPQEENKPVAGDKEIEFSEASRQFLQLMSPSAFLQGEGLPMSKELEERLSRPDLFDPLSFATSDSLLSVAKHKKLNVVASLPDEVVGFWEMVPESQPKTIETFLKRLEEGPARVQRLEGWMIVRPARPEEARKNRVDRGALATLIAAAMAKGSVWLDDLAAYALKNQEPMRTAIVAPYLTLFAPNAMGQGVSGLTDWNMLRLYGSFSPQQREALASGAALAFSNLSLAQQELVRKMAFGSSARLKVLDPAAKEEPGGFLGMMRRFLPPATGDWREEPTEAMPDGLPSAGRLTMHSARELVGAPTGAGAMGRMMGVVGADEIAMFRYFTEDPRMSALAGGMMPRIEGLRLGARTAMRFTFAVAPQVVFEHSLNDDRIDKNAAATPMDRLPEEFNALVEKRLEELKRNPLPLPPIGGSPPPRD